MNCVFSNDIGRRTYKLNMDGTDRTHNQVCDQQHVVTDAKDQDLVEGQQTCADT